MHLIYRFKEITASSSLPGSHCPGVPPHGQPSGGHYSLGGEPHQGWGAGTPRMHTSRCLEPGGQPEVSAECGFPLGLQAGRETQPSPSLAFPVHLGTQLA